MKPRATIKTYEVEVYGLTWHCEPDIRRVYAYTPEHAARLVAKPTAQVLAVREVTEAERVEAIKAHYAAACMDTSKGPPCA